MIGNPLLFWLTPYGGMKVYEEPLQPPKIQLREHVQVSDEFRRDVNAWLLARFGRKKSVLDRDKFLVSKKYGFVVAPHGMARILGNIGA